MVQLKRILSTLVLDTQWRDLENELWTWEGWVIIDYESYSMTHTLIKEFDLGLDIRTAAYISSLQKVYQVYREAGFN